MTTPEDALKMWGYRKLLDGSASPVRDQIEAAGPDQVYVGFDAYAYGDGTTSHFLLVMLSGIRSLEIGVGDLDMVKMLTEIADVAGTIEESK